MKARLRNIWKKQKKKIVNTSILLMAIVTLGVYATVVLKNESVIANASEETKNKQKDIAQKKSIVKKEKKEIKEDNQESENLQAKESLEEELDENKRIENQGNDKLIEEGKEKQNIVKGISKNEDTSNTPSQDTQYNNGGSKASANTSNTGTDKIKEPAESQKTWVEAVYKTVNHPAEYRTETYVVKEAWIESIYEGEKAYCYCGIAFDSTNAWAYHSELSGRGSACNGYSIQPYYTQIIHPTQYETRQVLIKEAWSEQVLVSAGYWK